MVNLSVRVCRENDFSFIYGQIARERWGLTRRQVHSMVNYERPGCFVAEVDGKRVGQIFSICYGDFGWIALLAVEPEFRGKGIGGVLLKKSTDYLAKCGAKTVGLEARYTVAGLYRKFGFVDAYEIRRLVRLDVKFSRESLPMVEKLEPQMVDSVARFDAEYSWGNRTKAIANLQKIFPSYCFVVRKNSEIAGYVMCSQTENGYRVGPWVCDPAYSEVAQALLLKCLSTLDESGRISVGVPEVNRQSIELLRGLGFEEQMKSVHLFRGERLKSKRLDGIFAIAGPEKG
jgi:ribosomal protein S18 acetylase RimI-like enzyme